MVNHGCYSFWLDKFKQNLWNPLDYVVYNSNFLKSNKAIQVLSFNKGSSLVKLSIIFKEAETIKILSGRHWVLTIHLWSVFSSSAHQDHNHNAWNRVEKTNFTNWQLYMWPYNALSGHWTWIESLSQKVF